jgi:hypothetical protein
MKKVRGYLYSVTVPAAEIQEGFLRYFISVRENGKSTSFPGSREGSPSDWDFNSDKSFEVRVVPPGSAVFIFNALSDNNELTRPWNRESSFAPLADPGRAEVRINIEKLFMVDPENPKAEKVQDYSMRYFFKKKIEGRNADLADKKKIVFRGRSLTVNPSWVQLALVTKDGNAYGALLRSNPNRRIIAFRYPI